MILSSICHVNVDHCQQRCHLQFTMVCADTEIGLGLDSENNNIRICTTSGASEIKKSRKRIFIFFLICPNLESAGLKNYLSKTLALVQYESLINNDLSLMFVKYKSNTVMFVNLTSK